MRARDDDELPPLPPGLSHLRGLELVRAAYAATKPGQAPVSRPSTRPWHSETSPPVPVAPEAPWTPTSVLDDIPPGPEPDEEDWR